jgi:hypothetical protein
VLVEVFCAVVDSADVAPVEGVGGWAEGLGRLDDAADRSRESRMPVRKARAPLDGVAFGVNDLALALGDAGVGVDGGGRGRIDGEGRYAPHAVGIVGAPALDAKPTAIAPISAPRVSSVPELCAVGGNTPPCE